LPISSTRVLIVPSGGRIRARLEDNLALAAGGRGKVGTRMTHDRCRWSAFIEQDWLFLSIAWFNPRGPDDVTFKTSFAGYIGVSLKLVK
jgi:hypothetical protein